MVVLHGPGPKILVKRIQNLDSLVVMFMVPTPLAPLVPVRAVRSAASEAASHPHSPKILFDLQEGVSLLLEAYGSKKKVSY